MSLSAQKRAEEVVLEGQQVMAAAAGSNHRRPRSYGASVRLSKQWLVSVEKWFHIELRSLDVLTEPTCS